MLAEQKHINGEREREEEIFADKSVVVLKKENKKKMNRKQFIRNVKEI